MSLSQKLTARKMKKKKKKKKSKLLGEAIDGDSEVNIHHRLDAQSQMHIGGENAQENHLLKDYSQAVNFE